MSTLDRSVSYSKSEQTRQKLLDAGVRLFSEQGYAATSTRQVQEAAGVQRNLITYHFGGKEAFWKACMTQLFDGIRVRLVPAIEQARDIGSTERIGFLVRQFVRASAAYPESTRIMFDEGRCDDWRLDWLVDHYVRPFYDTVSSLYEQSGLGESGLSLVQFYYVLVSSAAVFAMAPEYRRLCGNDPFDDTLVDAQANAIAKLVTAQLQTPVDITPARRA